MRHINARTTLKLIVYLCCFVGAAAVGRAHAGDYYIFQEPNGQLVISNSAPPAGSKVIKKETLSEATDQQIAASRLREETVGLDNRVASLEKSIGELAENVRAQNEKLGGLQQGSGDTNIAVGVTQGGTALAQPWRRPFNNQPNFNRGLPNGQPRSVVPPPPQHRLGERAGKRFY
jgi:hypothetical protein